MKKERTPGKHTLLGTLIAIMAVVGSVSVGFSAWTFGNSTGGAISGDLTINADTVMGNYFEAQIISAAPVTQYGFLANETFVNEGTFTLTYNIINFQDILQSKINFDFSLTYDSSKLTSFDMFSAANCSVSQTLRDGGSSFTYSIDQTKAYTVKSHFSLVLPSSYPEKGVSADVKITVKNFDFSGDNGAKLASTLPSLKLHLTTVVSLG